MSEKRKKALIVYLGGLFIAAFMLVCISLWGQSQKGPITTSADRVIQLQSQIQTLETTIHKMELDMKNMENEMVEVRESYDFLLKNMDSAASAISESENKITAYQYMTQLQQARINDNKEEMTTLLDKLSPLLNYLEENDQAAYQAIKEYAQESPAE